MTEIESHYLLLPKSGQLFVCGESSKPRCIYANTNLTKQQEIQIISIKESKVFSYMWLILVWR